MKIGHIVNPVAVGESSDLFVAQPVTFRTMFAAKRFAIDQVDVELMVIGYEEDTVIFPDRFKTLPQLQRSVMDVGAFSNQRKLPLIRDILDAAVKNSDAEYFIYSNVDISPMPYFYSAVAKSLRDNDALVINRRTIDKCDSGNQPLDHYYCQAGEVHPGFDCFVFSRKQYEQFQLFDACIGANWIGRVLICNLLAFANQPKIIKDGHLTFHLGDDRSWKSTKNIDFDEHNEEQVSKLMAHLHHQNLCDKHPLLEQSYQEFYLKTLDPDSTRPKREDQTVKAETTMDTSSQTTAESPAEPAKVDFSVLPQQHRYSSNWSEHQDLALRQDPVFVVGHPRSGTTLLQSLVATQLTPAIFPETHFFSIVRSLIQVAGDVVDNDSLEKSMVFLNEKLNLSPQCKQYLRNTASEKQLSPKMMFEALVYDQLSKNLSTEQIRDARWMEKTPDHAEHLEVIHRFYPDAKFIFVVRDPQRAILSRRKHFIWNNESSWPIDRHADRWLTTINSVDQFFDNNPEKIHYVRFEDVVQDQQEQISAICRFLEIPFSAELLEDYRRFNKQQNLEWEDWKKSTEQDISSDIANGVANSLSVEDCRQLQTRLFSHLERFGYQVTEPDSSPSFLQPQDPVRSTLAGTDGMTMTMTEPQAKTEPKTKPKSRRHNRIAAKESLLRALESCDNRHFENVLQHFYGLCIEPGDRVVDVGAHKGRHTFPMAEAVGNNGTVYAFEPIPKLHNALHQEIGSRGLQNQINLRRLALSHESGNAEFLVVEDEPGLSGLRERTSHNGHDIQKIAVEVEKMDDMIPESQRLSFIKTDAEGADFYILKGATRILENDRPVVAFECGRINSFPAASYGYEESEFNQFFDSMEYVLYDIAGLKYDPEFWNKPTLNDLVAIPLESEDYYREMLAMATLREFSGRGI